MFENLKYIHKWIAIGRSLLHDKILIFSLFPLICLRQKIIFIKACLQNLPLFDDDTTYWWEVFVWHLIVPPILYILVYFAYLPLYFAIYAFCLWYSKKQQKQPSLFSPPFDIIKKKKSKIQKHIIYKGNDMLDIIFFIFFTMIWCQWWYQYTLKHFNQKTI